MSAIRRCLAALSACLLVSCASVGTRLGEDLAAGIANHDDPHTVAEALPAYLVLLDGLISSRPDNAGMLRAAAELYGLYAGSFVAEPERARLLSGRALHYARAAVCEDRRAWCAMLDGPVDVFVDRIDQTSRRDVPELFNLAAAWTSYIRANSDDFRAIAALPKAQALIARVTELDPDYRGGMPFVYLGVLHSLRPAALGGRPDLGLAAFQRAIEASNGTNLMAMTMQAEFHARLVFDREAHDVLVRRVVEADPRAPGMTLSNVLAQQRARELEEEADDYF